MTKDEARERMREMLESLGAKGVALLAAEVLDDNAKRERCKARLSVAPHERAGRVVLCGISARDAYAFRCAAEAASDGTRTDTSAVPTYLATAFDRWNVNELYVRRAGTLGRKSDKRLDPDATAAMRKVYNGDTSAFHEDATCWLSVNAGA